MTDWNKISAFMAAVVPWPGSGEPGYVNLAYSFVDRTSKDGKKNGKFPISSGKPFRDVPDLIQRAAWMNTTTQFKDQWFCLSLQSQTKQNVHNAGKLSAVRSAANALKLKALWIDIDVKPSQYPTLADALKALFEFCAKAGLPAPSALVASGGGLHVYWISHEALTPAQWRPYAEGLKALLLQHGLKCDAGLTTDQARILRMPGTFNHKSDPPKPVTLLDQPLVVYNFETTLEFLTKIAPVSSVPGQAAPHSIFAEGTNAAAFKGGPAFTVADTTSLADGIDKFADQLISIVPIMKQCAFYGDALKNGGADYDQPLWMLSILGTTFMENGNAVAHAISSGHASYTKDDTQALYDRKVAERADRGIGYPSCAAIAGSGCKACQTCPLLAKGKSPLNLRPPPPPVTATVTQSAAAVALSLPAGYDVNDKDIICKVVETKLKDGTTDITLVPLFHVKLSGFWAQKNNMGHALNYTVAVDKGHSHQASVPMAEMGKLGFQGWLLGSEARTLFHPDGATWLGKFYMSMLNKLWIENASQEALPFGWHRTAGVIDGFTYGGVTRFEDGSVKPCGIGDGNFTNYYRPVGNIEPWFEAAKTVTDRQRPELTAIMLVGFAGPLLHLSGHRGAVFSSWGESGAGKSAAFSVGMAIWGDPLKSKGSVSSTVNHVTSQMAEIRHLPYYWDEIKNDQARARVLDVAHDLTDGVEKGRKISGTKTQDRGVWSLPMIAAANGSFREYLNKNNHNHAASINRVLEWWVEKIDGGPGHLSDAVATKKLAALDNNYGKMGETYAAWLAANHKQVAADYEKMSLHMQAQFGTGSAERYWILEGVILVLAARYARILGAEVYESQIMEWVTGVIKDNIAQRDQLGMAGKVDNADEALTRYIKERSADERIIWTNYIHRSKGRPPKPVTVLKAPTAQKNSAGGVEVRVALDNREVLIARRDFESWATDKANGYALAGVYGALEKLGMRIEAKVMLLSGTSGYGIAGGREPVLVIRVDGPDHPLWDFMWTGATPEAKLAAEDNVPHDETIETGLTPVEAVVAFVQGATGAAGQV